MCKGKRPREEKELPSSKRTRSQTLSERNEEQAKIIEKARQKADELRLERQKALEARPIALSGQCGDGSLHISFLQMGQGDCCLIATPKGRVIMIDCGTDAHDDEKVDAHTKRVQDSIYSQKFLKDKNEIDVLILTHPDTDHYNKAKTVLKHDVKIHNVYYSAKFSDYSAGQTSAWIHERITDASFIKAVTHNKLSEFGFIQINDKEVQPADRENKVDRLDKQGGIRIVHEEDCKISILASNINQIYTFENKSIIDNDGEKHVNRGSIVTLIEVFNQKILICGDATRNTEHYLVESSGARIADVFILQAPHHGSNNTSSSERFVNKTNPINVVMSAGKKIDKDHLPSAATISRYEVQQELKEEVGLHEIFYWQKGAYSSYFHESRFTKRAVYVTGSSGTLEHRFEKSS